MKAHRFVSFVLFALLLSAGLAAQEAEDETPEPLPASAGTATAVIGEQAFPIAMSVTAAGPLFALAPLAGVLGGELVQVAGGGYSLTVADTSFLLGPRSPQVVVERSILTLSQAPVTGEAGLEVPLDLLERTFGEILGYDFVWDAASGRLFADRQRLRELPVVVDLVHIRGTTTVVLQFPEDAPRYRVDEGRQRVTVELLGDRVRLAEAPARLADPLVRDVVVSPERIVIELAPDASASHYVLNRPFRLVFDVHEEAAAALEPEPVTRPRPRAGVHTIVLDPGHGGGETGAIGKGGAVEKELTLRLAQALKRRLEQKLPVKVVLTREEDASLPLGSRSAIANQNKADLFISLHLNSSRGDRARGAETYFLSTQASDGAAAAAAERENRNGSAREADGDGGDPLFDLQLILWDLAQSRHLAASQRLAKIIQQELNTTLGLEDRGVKQAPFAVLVGAAMPAVLVELGFLSNPEEEARLQDPSHRAELVEAIVRAVSRYRAEEEGETEGETEPEATAEAQR